MRIDHFAYQRATRVAGFGLLLQLIFGIGMMVFGLVRRDTSLSVAATYVLTGSLAWLGLVLIFHQHKLERLEALEIDELQQSRMRGGSAFDADAEGIRVQSRRLDLMHKWLMPILSLVIAGVLVIMGLAWLRWFSNLDAVDAGTGFVITPDTGFAVSICLALALASFIFSRFIAGMARIEAWQNLRGGAGFMVGNALVSMALAAGYIFVFLDNVDVIEAIARALPIFMFVNAGEIALNFVLNLYRPRKPGEVPRPAFDSRLLSLLSAPDSIVRSINEAVNYQFGFDVTSSWGYQLLVRRLNLLVLFTLGVLIVLNCIVVVEAHQQAVRLRGGLIVGNNVYGSGPMFKLPWPIERAKIYDVARIRELPLTAQMRWLPGQENAPHLWSEELRTDAELDPFLVAAGQQQDSSELQQLREEMQEAMEQSESLQEATMTDEQRQAEAQAERLSDEFALIETEIVVYYRIRETPDGVNGLLDWMTFSNDDVERRQRLTNRERALKDLALREVTQYASQQNLNAIIATQAADMTESLRMRIQRAFDAQKAGVDVVRVAVPWIRPAKTAARTFEELAFNRQMKQQRISQARRVYNESLTRVAGSASAGERIASKIDEYQQKRSDSNVSPDELAQLTADVEEALRSAGGMAANKIAGARSQRWIRPLAEEARARLLAGRLEAYRAGPEIYREYLTMDVLTRVMRDARKYFLAVDPRIFDIDVEMMQDDQVLNFEEAIDRGN